MPFADLAANFATLSFKSRKLRRLQILQRLSFINTLFAASSNVANFEKGNVIVREYKDNLMFKFCGSASLFSTQSI
jgi:hypothetical protein